MMMLHDEIRDLYAYPPLEDMGDNSFGLWMDLYRDEYFYGDADTHHLSLPAAISREVARTATIEMQAEADTQSEALASDWDDFMDHARAIVEKACAFGGVMLKPYIVRDGQVAVDIVAPDRFVALGANPQGEPVHVVFVDTATVIGEKDRVFYYTRLEEHDYDEAAQACTITNRAFVSESPGSLGEPANLAEVEAWEDIQEEIVIEHLERPLFSYLKYPITNHLDHTSPLGMSCFCPGIALIQDADEQYSRILWEYEGSELAIDADITALKNNGELPKGKERLFRDLGLDQADGFYNVFSPTIRDSSLFAGLNQILRRIEFVCGLSYGLISDVQDVTKTATEVKASRQRFYSTVTDLQKSISVAFRGLADSMAYLHGTMADISFSFDDSVLVDAETEQQSMLVDVSAGLIRPEIYIMRKYGVSEEEALEMMPSADPPAQDFDGIE